MADDDELAPQWRGGPPRSRGGEQNVPGYGEHRQLRQRLHRPDNPDLRDRDEDDEPPARSQDKNKNKNKDEDDDDR